MAAIFDFSHFCKFGRKSDDFTEFSIPLYINTQGFINEYAVLTELLGKNEFIEKLKFRGKGSLISISRNAFISEFSLQAGPMLRLIGNRKKTKVFPEMTILKEPEKLISNYIMPFYV